jgi:mRNA-degrading endonuclease YafQ of YafQ-DinJ toxin-antitoxin module
MYRVPGYRPRSPGSIPDATRFSENYLDKRSIGNVYMKRECSIKQDVMVVMVVGVTRSESQDVVFSVLNIHTPLSIFFII